MDSQGVTVQATRTSFRILETLAQLNGAGVTELATELDLPKSTVHNHLNTLHSIEYVVKDGDAYDVGLQFLNLGEYSRNRLKLYEIARPEIKALAEQTGELVNLSVEEYNRGVYLYLVRGDRAVQLDTHAGMQVHLHCTALGKAMLAHMDPERVDQIIETFGLPARTEHTITDRETLLDERRDDPRAGIRLRSAGATGRSPLYRDPGHDPRGRRRRRDQRLRTDQPNAGRSVPRRTAGSAPQRRERHRTQHDVLVNGTVRYQARSGFSHVKISRPILGRHDNQCLHTVCKPPSINRCGQSPILPIDNSCAVDQL